MRKNILPPGVKWIELENGLILILKEDHSAPVATVHVWCRTGSVNEGAWMGAGMSHVLEHMLFKGTESRSGARIDQEVQEAGGQMNACTSFNYTLYYIDVPATGVKTAIDILCDITRKATLPADELEKERQVILREMDMGEDDPDRRSSRRLFEIAYRVSPYRHPVIGYKSIFEKFTRADLLSYYKQRYVPNNLFFVVVGDINPEEVKEQIKQTFADSCRIALAPEILPFEPVQVGPRRVEEEGNVELCYTHLAWHIPSALHSDIPGLGVVSAILGSGRSSRLFRRLREQQGIVQKIDSWIYAPGEQGLFGISAEIEADKYSKAIEEIYHQVEILKEELVSEEELEKIKKQCVAALYASRKTMSGQALDLGSSWLAAQDLNFSELSLERIRTVTSEDVRRIVRTWFREENSVHYSLMPKGSKSSEKTSDKAIIRSEIKQIKLSNGLSLLTKQDSRLPFVELRMVFRGGLLSEDEESNGRSLMMSRLLLKGTQKRSAERLAEELEGVGGKIETYIANGTFGISVEVLKEDFELGLDILADVVMNSVFPQEALELERQMILAEIRAEKDQMLTYALKKMRRELFGPVSYGLSGSGNSAAVEALTREMIVNHWRDYVLPDNCVLSVFGDIDSSLVAERIEKYFAEWVPGKKEVFLNKAEPIVSTVPRRVEESQPDKNQAVVIMGYPGVSIYDKRIYPLIVLKEICSDLGSRLFLRIRDELALAYYVGAYQQCGVQSGYFCFYAGTQPKQAEQVVNELLVQAALLRESGVTEEELTRAKAKILGQRAIAKQDIGDMAKSCAESQITGLGYDYLDREDQLIQDVTLEDVLKAARDILTSEGYVISIVKPE